MMLVLLAMGIYGSGVVGWQIRTSNDIDVVAKAKDLHPKLALGMTGFFALGAVGEQGGRVGGGRGDGRRRESGPDGPGHAPWASTARNLASMD
jgi:hypothetical protein